MTKHRKPVPNGKQGEGRASNPSAIAVARLTPGGASERARRRQENRARHSVEHSADLERRRQIKEAARAAQRREKLDLLHAERQTAREAEQVVSEQQGAAIIEEFASKYRLEDGWAERIARTGPEEALVEIVKQVSKLHDAALSAPEFSSDERGLKVRWVFNVPAALACAREIRTLLGLERFPDETLSASRMTPQERVLSALSDPIHGPLLREAVLREGSAQ